VIAQPRPAISQFTKLIKFMSPQVMMGMFIMCLLAYAVFLKTEGNMKAGLEVIRLI